MSEDALRSGIELAPGIFTRPSISGNLFDASRPGRAVVRPEDLLAMRVQLVNLEVVPGTPPRLRRIGTDPAFLVLHHPPQSIAEEVFYETPAAGVTEATPDAPPAPDGKPAPGPPPDGDVDPMPIRARAAGESRVVFVWPTGFECDYTVDGLLRAVQALDMKVPPAALPRQGRGPITLWPGVATIKEHAYRPRR